MKSSHNLLIAFVLCAFALTSCLQESNPVHIIADVQNMDRESLKIQYVLDADTLITKDLSVDTIQSMPFASEMQILIRGNNQLYNFNKIPAAYLNDLGKMSLSRKVYQDDIFPKEWQQLTDKNIDYVTLKFIASETKRFAIVLDANTGVEIGRYFEKMD